MVTKTTKTLWLPRQQQHYGYQDDNIMVTKTTTATTPTGGLEGVGEAVVVDGVEGQKVVQELVSLVLATQKGVTFV